MISRVSAGVQLRLSLEAYLAADRSLLLFVALAGVMYATRADRLGRETKEAPPAA